jgi:hypothetical protein
MIQIGREMAISKLIEADIEVYTSGERIGRQTLAEILKFGSPEYGHMDDDELEEALVNEFDEEYKIV